MNIQQALTQKVLQITTRQPKKGDFLIDEKNHQWIYDGQTWFDFGLNKIQTLVSGYGTKISEGLISIDENIVALKTDVLDANLTINNFQNIRQISITGLNVNVDPEVLGKVNITFQTQFVQKEQLSEVAFSGDYQDLSNKPKEFILQPATVEKLGGIKVDNKTIQIDEYGNISVPKASITQHGLVKLNTDYLNNSNEQVPTSYAVRTALTEVQSHSSYLYIAYASDQNGKDWSLIPFKTNGNFLEYRAQIISQTPIQQLTSQNFKDAIWVKYVGNDCYLYIGFASDDKGTNFTTTPSRQVKYAGFLVSYIQLKKEQLQSKFKEKNVQWVKYIGDNSYSYIAYAKDNKGNGFSLLPSTELKYIGYLVSDAEIKDLNFQKFKDVTWVKYIGQDVYLYVGYAVDQFGNGFSTIPDFSRPYIATLIKYQPIERQLVAQDFNGVLWTRYIGKDSYLYVAYASDQNGTNFSLQPSDQLPYRAELHSLFQITDIRQQYFIQSTWVRYIGKNAYVKCGYAIDEHGNGFSTIPDFNKKYIAQITLYEDRDVTLQDFPIQTTKWVRYVGYNSYVYFGYASNELGENFSLIPDKNLKYISTIVVEQPIQNLTQQNFQQSKWVKYIGEDTYTYVSYAKDLQLNDWGLIPTFQRKYRSQIHVQKEIEQLTIQNFRNAKWVRYIGVDTYTYVGYASNEQGDDFSLTPSQDLIYRKQIHTQILLNPPKKQDFGIDNWIQIIPRLSIGNVTSGQQAKFENVGTEINPVFDIVLPRGADGVGITPQGIFSESVNYSLNDVVRYGKYLWRCKVENTQGIYPPNDQSDNNEYWDLWLQDGKSSTIQIGQIRISDNGVANVINVGNNYNAILDFVIPRGEIGYSIIPKIDQNYNLSWSLNDSFQIPNMVNIKGKDGVSTHIQQPTYSTETLQYDQQARVEIDMTGTQFNKKFDFKFFIPKGKDGVDGKDGTNGINGVDGTNGIDGKSAGFDQPTAKINVLPYGMQASVEVQSFGEDTNKRFQFLFNIPEGRPGRSMTNQVVYVYQLKNSFIQVSDVSFPVWVQTSKGNFYPIQKTTLTHENNVYKINPNCYLAYDNTAIFEGPWVIYYAGGTEGTLNIVQSSIQPDNPIDGMIWIENE